jgi:hypothetical protein
LFTPALATAKKIHLTWFAARISINIFGCLNFHTKFWLINIELEIAELKLGYSIFSLHLDSDK